jgi:hypothetical protein
VGETEALVHEPPGSSGLDFSQPFQGKSNRENLRSLGSNQVKLIHQWMGTGVQGAQQAMGAPLPAGLTKSALQGYHEIARRQIEAGLDTVGTQAARLQLIERALYSTGP